MNQGPIRLAKATPIKSLITGFLLVGLCLLSGCDMKLPPMPWDPKPKPKAEDASADAAGEEGGDSGAKEGPTPVNELDFLPPAMKKLPFEEVNIPLKDGLIIYGRLYDPAQKPESDDPAAAPAADAAAGDEGEYKGPKYPLVILIHGLDRDHTTWSDLPASLVKAGYSVFAMDLRGHGKSTSTIHQRRVTWRFFEPEHWLLLPKDVDEVIQYFQKSEDHPQIDGKTVGLIGEKLGANVAVFTARDMSPAVKAVILISPGLNYKGLIPSQAIIDYTNPALLITTQDDPYSYQSTERLYNWLLGLKALQVYKKIGDGTDMLSHQSALGDNMVDWLTQQMPSPERPKPPAAEIKPEVTVPAAGEAKTEGDKKPAGEAKPTEDKAKPPEKPIKKETSSPTKVSKPKSSKKIKNKKPAIKAAKVKKVVKPEAPNSSQPPIPGA